MRIGRAVQKNYGAPKLVHARVLDPLCSNVPSPLEEKTFGGADGNIHGIYLVDDREQVGLGRDQTPFVDSSPLNHPVDGSGYKGVVKVELRLDQITLRSLQRRRRPQLFGHRIINILLTHRLLRQERLQDRKI